MYIPYSFYHVGTYVQRLSIKCDVDSIGQNKCHGCKHILARVGETSARCFSARVSTCSRMLSRTRMYSTCTFLSILVCRYTPVCIC